MSDERTERDLAFETSLSRLTERIDALEVNLTDVVPQIDLRPPQLSGEASFGAFELAPQFFGVSPSLAFGLPVSPFLGPFGLFAIGDLLSAKSVSIGMGTVMTDTCSKGKATILLPNKGFSAQAVVRVAVKGTPKTHCSVRAGNTVVDPGKSPVTVPFPLNQTKFEIGCIGGQGLCEFTYELGLSRTTRGGRFNRLKQFIQGQKIDSGTLDTKCKNGKVDIKLTRDAGANQYVVRLDVKKDSACGVSAIYGNQTVLTVNGGGSSGIAIFKGSGGTLTLKCGGTNANDACKAEATIVRFKAP